MSSNSTYIRRISLCQLYYAAPRLCTHCNQPLDWFRRHQKFCNSSCAASHSNTRRSPRSAESKLKTSKALIGRSYVMTEAKWAAAHRRQSQCKISFCENCNKLIPNKHRKSCSSKCKAELQSKRLSNLSYRQQHNYGRKSMSYMEKSFSEWISQYDIFYLFEPSFHNDKDGRTYFPDFYFPAAKLIVELDGSQHLKTKDKDQYRDAFIKMRYGIDVMRITQKEFRAGTRIQELTERLLLG